MLDTLGPTQLCCWTSMGCTDQTERPQQAAWKAAGRPGTTLLRRQVAGERVQARGAVQPYHIEHAQ